MLLAVLGSSGSLVAALSSCHTAIVEPERMVRVINLVELIQTLN